MANKRKLFKRGSTSFRILIISFIYVFLLISFLAPILLVKDYSKVFAIIVVAVISVAYIFAVLMIIWDYIKTKSKEEDK